MIEGQLIERLKALKIFSNVQYAVNIKSAMESKAIRYPAAFVCPVSERPRENERDTGEPIQFSTLTYGVLFVVQPINDKTGEKANKELQTLRLQVRKQCFGWVPNVEGQQQFQELLLGHGDLVSFTEGTLLWIDRFTTETEFEAFTHSED